MHSSPVRGPHDEADGKEGEVDEPSIRVVPRTIWRNRPEHREPRPEDERSQQDDTDEARAIQAGPGKDSPKAQCEQDAGGEERERADPHEGAVRRSVSGKERERYEDARAKEQRRAGRGGAA